MTPSSSQTAMTRSTIVELVDAAIPGCAVETINCDSLSPSGLTWMPPIYLPSLNSTDRFAASTCVTLTSSFRFRRCSTAPNTLSGSTSTITLATS